MNREEQPSARRDILRALIQKHHLMPTLRRLAINPSLAELCANLLIEHQDHGAEAIKTAYQIGLRTDNMHLSVHSLLRQACGQTDYIDLYGAEYGVDKNHGYPFALKKARFAAIAVTGLPQLPPLLQPQEETPSVTKNQRSALEKECYMAMQDDGVYQAMLAGFKSPSAQIVINTIRNHGSLETNDLARKLGKSVHVARDTRAKVIAVMARFIGHHSPGRYPALKAQYKPTSFSRKQRRLFFVRSEKTRLNREVSQALHHPVIYGDMMKLAASPAEQQIVSAYKNGEWEASSNLNKNVRYANFLRRSFLKKLSAYLALKFPDGSKFETLKSLLPKGDPNILALKVEQKRWTAKKIIDANPDLLDRLVERSHSTPLRQDLIKALREPYIPQYAKLAKKHQTSLEHIIHQASLLYKEVTIAEMPSACDRQKKGASVSAIKILLGDSRNVISLRGQFKSQAIDAVIDNFKTDCPKTARELATETGLHVTNIYALLRSFKIAAATMIELQNLSRGAPLPAAAAKDRVPA